ncbi:hypothetical protein TD95_002979 [Thielaviopsis punctulata]|uniref:HMG box domain-containing protein n=1 Tax=Thielaviopsis punctulata TaxID=72032 RepID=A0A0F4ZIQ2_9PEZI|nr:hypothetical protein TD95_002979 [Thielaviopsis punctulata]
MSNLPDDLMADAAHDEEQVKDVDDNSSDLSIIDQFDIDAVEPAALHDQNTSIPGPELQVRSPVSSSRHDTEERSDVLSMVSSLGSKETTPIDIEKSTLPSKVKTASSHLATFQTPRSSRATSKSDFSSKVPQTPRIRPKSSIPPGIQPQEYASQCITAAEMCRLSPYALHPDEHRLLRRYITRPQVTTYLNLRNSILRLWVQNPQVAVTRREAIGCASQRWFEAASLCYDWLVRNGYINFGCVSYPKEPSLIIEPPTKQRTIVVIGAGVSGLGCARQLDGLFQQYSHDFVALNELPPRVIVVEARNRVGGRVYSKAFNATPDPKSGFAGARCTAEMGGMIITGFYGNPLNFLVRGQLGLAYHALRPETTLYDSNGLPADLESDQVVEHLFNDSLDRVSEYKFDIKLPPLVFGNMPLINEGRDSNSEGTWTLKQMDDAANLGAPAAQRQLASRGIRSVGEQSKYGRAALKAREMGWKLKPGVSSTETVNLDQAAHADKACMGSVFENAINQYTNIVEMKPLHLRLLNWHVANLEYSNATDLHNLSLGGWDIDAGNEWEGKHTMVIGGYQSMARGLLMCPQPLECRFLSPVQKIVYSPDFDKTADSKSKIICEDGTQIEADHIVCSIPLGVLKSGNVQFDPPIPEWKAGAIKRVGYGVLNKLILTYQDPFWEPDRDIFGILRDPSNLESLQQKDYAESRGRLFQWFNVSQSSGLPCLVALMAGKAGYATEKEDDKALVEEATTLLRKVFGEDVPYPKEVMVTRWASDKYSFGSYSSSGPDMQWNDYDTLAKPLGNLVFAGEHTIGTHPATVHGAYMSGLRAASEVLDSIIGPLRAPEALFPAKEATPSSLKRKSPSSHDAVKKQRQEHEKNFAEYVLSMLGPAPIYPDAPPPNAYSFFRRDNAMLIRQRCLAKRRAGTKASKIPSKDMSQMASRMWRELAPDERMTYEQRFRAAVVEYKSRLGDLLEKMREREEKVAELRNMFDELTASKSTQREGLAGISSSSSSSSSSSISSSIRNSSSGTPLPTQNVAVVAAVAQAMASPITATAAITNTTDATDTTATTDTTDTTATTAPTAAMSPSGQQNTTVMDTAMSIAMMEEETGIRISGLPARKMKRVSYAEDQSSDVENEGAMK